MAASSIGRRHLLVSTSAAMLAWSAGFAQPGAALGRSLPATASGLPPEAVQPGVWAFFTHDEVLAVEAIVDRLIPADALSIGGRDAGCVAFIDRQLAGSYGRADRLYMSPPFAQGLPQQGYQSPLSPAGLYRAGLAALDRHCRAAFLGKRFAELPIAQQDRVLADLEKTGLALDGVDGQSLFEQVLQNAMEGFFADPIYGGNRDMAGWTLIGFPGARYDYRDHLSSFDAPYDRPPVGLKGGVEWAVSDSRGRAK